MSAKRLALALLLLAAPAAAQMESREGIALQNQILQLRAELEGLRRGGGIAPPSAGPPRGGSEALGTLLERVNAMEEETRRLRGRLDESEFRNRQLSQAVEKLSGDLDFRMQQLEGGRSGRPGTPPVAGPPPGAPPTVLTAPGGPPVAPPVTTPAPRPPERAIADGQAALARRDFPAAEAAAREALANRGGGTRSTDAQLLLADALNGRRDFAGAALAYNDAYTRSRNGPRAPEALIGLANAFSALGNRREACDALEDLRSNAPNLRPPLVDRAAEARRRAGCR